MKSFFAVSIGVATILFLLPVVFCFMTLALFSHIFDFLKFVGAGVIEAFRQEIAERKR